jgi:hypothetical protein
MKISLLLLSVMLMLLTSCESRGVRVDDVKSAEEKTELDAEEKYEKSNQYSVGIELYGVFFESHFDSDTLYYPEGSIRLSDENGIVQDIEFDEFGNYIVFMDFDHSYEIRYKSPEHHTKFLTIDTRRIPQSLIGEGYYMPTDMSLAKNENELVNQLLSQNPIGKALMDITVGEFDWDLEYTDSLKAVVEQLESVSPLP